MNEASFEFLNLPNVKKLIALWFDPNKTTAGIARETGFTISMVHHIWWRARKVGKIPRTRRVCNVHNGKPKKYLEKDPETYYETFPEEAKCIIPTKDPLLARLQSGLR